MMQPNSSWPLQDRMCSHAAVFAISLEHSFQDEHYV